MRREPPDSRFYAEVRDLNMAFLELVNAGRYRRRGPVFGLDPAIVDHIARFDPSQLGELAAIPCLLAGFAGARGGRVLQRVAEPTPADPDWAGQVGLFATGLLTFVWQAARGDPLRAALCGGAQASALAGDLRFTDIRALASRSLQHLAARFVDPARFWPDLVRAVRDGHPGRLRLARLTAIQLATTEADRHPPAAPDSIASRPVCATAGLR